MTSLGYRNNNPGNLIKGGNSFLGEIIPSTDPRFRQFKSMEYGYRAGLKLLLSYISKGYNTIDKIINRWAPSNENDTQAYIKSVVQQTGIPAGKVLTTSSSDYLIKIMSAISQHENGVKPDISSIQKGWELLGKKKF